MLVVGLRSVIIVSGVFVSVVAVGGSRDGRCIRDRDGPLSREVSRWIIEAALVGGMTALWWCWLGNN